MQIKQNSSNQQRFLFYVTLVVLAGCATLGGVKLNQLYGPSLPRERIVERVKPGNVDYWHDVQPILEKRCVVCHGCYDAPCQLKLGSIEGIERGATKVQVYNPTRILEAETTRLFEDAHSVEQWRKKGFFPVLNEHEQSVEANRAAGVMYQLLTLKAKNPLPNTTLLGDEFKFDLNRKHVCPNPETVSEFADDHPLWGMPYAMPALNVKEHTTLTRWLEQGAVHTKPQPLADAFNSLIKEWERFLNQDSFKGKLTSRYIYEHLFLAHLYFDELDARHYFRLVRSRTPPGMPINVIATRRPYDDPGVERVYYRIQEYQSAIVAKTHMPYALNGARMQRWQQLFFTQNVEVKSLPDYDPMNSANPFKVFQQLPVAARYEFMLDEAQFTVMGFIKGPVCRGQVALNVINDHFWVFFVNPDSLENQEVADFIAENSSLLSIPSEQGSIYRPITNWKNYSKKQKAYRQKLDHRLSSIAGKELAINLDLIWDGYGSNDNAALTVLRHFDSATVEKGLLGPPPKTAWVIGYVDLERIHYLLVAGYDVYGNVGHQLLSRLYMDFLRMDGESKFLLFLPQSARDSERAYWYRGADKAVMEYLQTPQFENAHVEPDIAYHTDQPKLELYSLLKNKLKQVLNSSREITALPNQNTRQQLQAIYHLTGNQISAMPQNAILTLETDHGDEYFSIVKNNAHLNITSMFSEQDNRAPSDDQLMIFRGFVGSYPNAIFNVKESEIVEFVGLLEQTATEEGFRQLMDRFGVRRTQPDFWKFSDRIHRGYSQMEPIEFGMLDYNRLDNR